MSLMYNIINMELLTLSSLLGIRKDLNKLNDAVTPKFDPDKLGPKKVYISWESHVRPTTKQKDSKLSRTMLVIGVFIGLLLILMQEYALIVLIASLVFVNEAIKKSAPQLVKHEASTHGFSYAGQMYYWHQLRRFFFSSDEMLCIDTYDVLPGRLFVVCSSKDKKQIKEALEKHINYLEEAPKTSFEKAYESILGKLNLD